MDPRDAENTTILYVLVVALCLLCGTLGAWVQEKALFTYPSYLKMRVMEMELGDRKALYKNVGAIRAELEDDKRTQ